MASIAKEARAASIKIKSLTPQARIDALKAIYEVLKKKKDCILDANKRDMESAHEQQLSPSLIKRLDLGKGDKYDTMLQGMLDVAALEDPVGKVTLHTKLDEGLDLLRVKCPVGVLLVIFEARPEVIANITALAIKSGNAVILKGGKESHNSFLAISQAVSEAIAQTDVDPKTVQLISSRSEVGDLLSEDKYIDLVIPRGSNELVKNIKERTKIPVLCHADGLCTIYIDAEVDVEMAIRIVIDAKTTYPAGCNAVETLLLHRDAVDEALPQLIRALIAAGVTVKAADDVMPQILQNQIAGVSQAADGDFDTEFLSLTIAVKSVTSLEEAIRHINEHGSHHTDAIVTNNEKTANKFLSSVDSAGVYWNASTRFADGFRYGFGTEVGVSTNKIHARGPMGLEGLVGYQYHIRGSGQVSADYIGAGGNKKYLHEKVL